MWRGYGSRHSEGPDAAYNVNTKDSLPYPGLQKLTAVWHKVAARPDFKKFIAG